MAFDVDGAFKAGANEDQVLDHLVKSRPFDVDGAMKAGASKRQIIDHLAASDAPAAAKPRTFWDSLGDAGKAFWERTGQPIADASQYFSADPAAHQKAVDAIHGAVTSIRDIPATMHRELAETGRSLIQGKPGDAAYHAAGAVPLAGPPAQEIASDFDNGDYAKGFGHGAALVAPFVAPEALSRLKQGVSGAAGNAAEGLYKTALKPRIDTPAADVRAMAQTGLKNELPISEAGAVKLPKLVADHQAVIDPALKNARKRGVTIDPNAVAARLGDTRAQFETQVNPSKDLKAIRDSENDFLNTQGRMSGTPAGAPTPTGVLDASGKPIMKPGTPAVPATPAKPMSPEYAQTVKQGTYRQIKAQYDKMGTAQIESQKTLARGIKEELGTQIPEINEPLGAQGKLLDLDSVLAHSVDKAANTALVGPVVGAVGAIGGFAMHGVEGGAIGAGLGIMAKVLADPALRSRLAITIYKAQQANPGKYGLPSMAAATARVAAYNAALQKATMPAPADLASHYAKTNPGSTATPEEMHAAAEMAIERHNATR